MRTHFATTLLMLLLAAIATSCGALMKLGSSSGDAISFASGELQSREIHSLENLDVACRTAVSSMGYEEISFTQGEEESRWQARTAGGDPVEVRLIAKGPKRTELRIRVGVLGDEARSRLLLEQIHQSL